MSEIKIKAKFGLSTDTKLFCNCSTAPFKPNTRCCPTCLGLPGAMPSINGRAMELAVEAVRALGCELINPCVFYKQTIACANDASHCGALRYCDIGKGAYQVSIAEEPGHEDYNGMVNLNRRGMPLIEVVAQTAEGLEQEKYLELCALLSGICEPLGFERSEGLPECYACFADCDIPPIELTE